MAGLGYSPAIRLGPQPGDSGGSTPFASYPALAAAYNDDGRGSAGFIGDSITANISGAIADYTTTFCQTIISDLNTAGMTAIDGFQFGSHNNGVTGPFAYDAARLTSPHPLRWNVAGPFQTSDFTVGTQLTFTPGLTHDRVRKGNVQLGIATSYTITRNGVLLDTIPGTGSSYSVSTYSVASGTHGITVELAAYGGFSTGVLPNPFFQCYPSATQHIQICQMGESGYTTGDWLTGYPGTATAILNIALAVECDAYFIMLGANDQNTGVSDATFEANLTSLVIAVQQIGKDVRLVIPPPAGGASSAANISAGKIAAFTTVSTARNLLPPIDCNTPFLPFNAADFQADGLHLTPASTVTVGHIISAAMRETTPPVGGIPPFPTTWNPLDKDARITLSGNNLTVTGDGAGWESVRATDARTTTAYYEKIAGPASTNGIGFANLSASMTTYLGIDGNGIMYLPGGSVFFGGGSVARPAYVGGDVVRASINPTTGDVTFSVNGTPSASINVPGLIGSVYPGCSTVDANPQSFDFTGWA